MDFYKLGIDETLNVVESSTNGLSENEAKQRLEKYGENKLKEQEKNQ